MQLHADKAVFIGRKGELAIDPSSSRVKAKNVVVTHAHADHSALPSKQGFSTLLTSETRALLECRGRRLSLVRELSFGEKLQLDGVQLSMHNSGHIFGAAQLLLEGSKSIAFTSDFKLQDSLLQKGALPLSAEILVIETTFGLPEFRFPERERVYGEIGKWVSSNSSRNKFSILCGYSVGKAQELTRVVNEYSSEVPLVHESVFNANRACEGCGLKLGSYSRLESNLDDSSVLIMPPSLASDELIQALSLSLGKKIEVAVATGWSKRLNGFKGFPLSDHADFAQCMEYVERCSPKLVLTHHGFAREFARAVKKKFRIPAAPLGERSQRTLQEF